MPSEGSGLGYAYARSADRNFVGSIPVARTSLALFDFVCLEHRLIVEVDGSQHLDGADAKRDAWLVSQGYKVLRFWDNQVLTETVAVAEAIAQAVSAEEGPPS